MKLTPICFTKSLMLVATIVLASCGTFLPESVTLRPLPGSDAYVLEIETTQKNELNVHTFGFDTYKRKHILFLGSKGPIIDGSQITISSREKAPHPIGTVSIQGNHLKVELKVPFWDSDKKDYRFTDFNLNGSYLLREDWVLSP